jgi:vacuolar-type H+-ATPase subunit H
MSTFEIRNIISQKLLLIEDLAFLQNINHLIESKINERIYLLSEEQKLRIEEARNEYYAEITVADADVEMEVERWLNEK